MQDFLQYRMRFGAGMPPAASPSRGGNGTFSSFNVGLVHYALVSSEVYMDVGPHSALLAIEQAQWLEADLAAVNRTETPFVALGLHQPFYCSANDDQVRGSAGRGVGAGVEWGGGMGAGPSTDAGGRGHACTAPGRRTCSLASLREACVRRWHTRTAWPRRGDAHAWHNVAGEIRVTRPRFGGRASMGACRLPVACHPLP